DGLCSKASSKSLASAAVRLFLAASASCAQIAARSAEVMVPSSVQQLFAQGRRLLGLKGGRPLAMHAIATVSIAGPSLELVFGPFVVQKGATGIAEERGEFRPGIRRAHINDADRLDARPRRLGQDEVGDFARLYTAPEFLFRRDQDAEIKWVHGNRDLHPFASAGDDREHRGMQVGDPHVVL